MTTDFLLKDIQFSPLFWHTCFLLLSSIKALVLKLLSRANESYGWDGAVMLLLFCNPFFAFFADSFWHIWLQSLLLGPLLYFIGFYFRNSVFRFSDYSDPAAACMMSLFVFLIGHLVSVAIWFICYLWEFI